MIGMNEIDDLLDRISEECEKHNSKEWEEPTYGLPSKAWDDLRGIVSDWLLETVEKPQ